MKCTFLFFVVLAFLSGSEVFAQTAARDSIRVRHVQERYLRAADGDTSKAKQIAIIQIEHQDSKRAVLARRDIDISTRRKLVDRLDSTLEERLRAIIGDDRLSRRSVKDKPVAK